MHSGTHVQGGRGLCMVVSNISLRHSIPLQSLKYSWLYCSGLGGGGGLRVISVVWIQLARSNTSNVFIIE